MTEFLHWIYRIWRILLNVLSWAVTLVLLVVTLSLLTFQLRPIKQLILNEVLERVNSTIEGEVTINELSGFLPFSLQLYDVTLYSQKVLSDSLVDQLDPLIEIPEVRVQLDLSELISGTFSIRSFRAIRPAVYSHWDRETETWDLTKALVRGEPSGFDHETSTDSVSSTAISDTLRTNDSSTTLTLYIPELSIENGVFQLVKTGTDDEGIKSVDSIRVDQIFTSLFFESNPDRRVVDLTEFSASLSSYDKNTVQISGQLFQDSYTTELNGLRVRTLGSELYLNASAAIGLDESRSVSRLSEFQNRDFEIRLDRTIIDVKELATFGLPVPVTELPDKIEVDIQLSSRDGITFLDDLELFSGNSYANLEGKFDLNSWDRNLALSLTSAEISLSDFPNTSQIHKLFSVLPDLRIRGELYSKNNTAGTTPSGLVAELSATQRDIQSQAIEIIANLSTSDRWSTSQTELSLNLDSLNWELSPFLGSGVDLPSDLDDDDTLLELLRAELSLPSLTSGEIVASFQYNGQEFRFENLTGNISDNQIGSLNLGGFSFIASSLEDTLTYELDGGFATTQFSTKGSLVTDDMKAPLFFAWWDPETVKIGKGRNQNRWTQITTVTDLRLSELLPTLFQDKTEISLLLQSDLEVGFPEYKSGNIRLLTQNLTLEGRPIDDISLLASLEQTTDSNSTFSLISTLGQLKFRGELSPLSLPESIRQISQSLSDKLDRQSFGLLNLPIATISRNKLKGRLPEQMNEEILKGEFQIEIDDLNPIAQIINSIELESQFQADGSIDLSPSRLFLQSDFTDSLFNSPSFTTSNFSGSLELLFFPEKELTQENRVLLEVSSDSVSTNIGQMKEVAASLSLLREDIAITIDSKQDPELFHLNLSSLLELQKDELELDLLALKAGKGEYEWVLSQPAGLSYSRGEVVSFRSFELENQSQIFQLNGTFSQAPGDSISLGIERLDLGEISDFLPGRLKFDGTANGQLTGTFPAGIPVIFGQMKIDRFELNDRSVGDFYLNSVYDPDSEQFNLDARLYTDLSVTENVNGVEEPVGQDFAVTGYVRNPASSGINLPKFDIQAEFNRIDLWILEEFLPNLIVSSKGIATGKARLFDPVREGREARPLLEGSAEIVNAELVPLFLNTQYAVSGQLSYSNRSGFEFNTLLLRDSFGGEARLSGLAGLTSLYEPIPLTLTLQMNRFQFINNPYNPDLPFYATVNGSGTLQLSGNSQNPVLRTPNPLQVTTNSRVSIPLLDVISVSQDNKFITFVDDFESWNASDANFSGRGRTQASSPASSQASEFSFTDQFTMDLQFVAQEPIRFEMIFDRITNEAIYGNGTGQMRLTLQDGNYQLFGAVDLSSGEYNFVSGDILTRRFQLEEGGRVVWDGNPTNAQLNVQAVYRARPPLSTLGVVSASSADQLGTSQRIPIELVLQIFGSMDQIQNEFYFRIPTGIAGFSDPTLATRISSLNRNQEEKLVQAFSILLTGNFIPTGESTFENTSVLSGLTGSAVLINPFVSTQLLSPLLSNQINSLLNENVTFDVDVNIDAYNEVELAVALRLYNDRLVLRREGQITGDQNRLGDLGATYRINRVLSLTAFHRQDPTFTSNTGQTSGDGGDNQVINGVGVEARFQFHTWKEFFRRLTSWMRRDETMEAT